MCLLLVFVCGSSDRATRCFIVGICKYKRKKDNKSRQRYATMGGPADEFYFFPDRRVHVPYRPQGRCTSQYDVSVRRYACLTDCRYNFTKSSRRPDTRGESDIINLRFRRARCYVTRSYSNIFIARLESSDADGPQGCRIRRVRATTVPQ